MNKEVVELHDEVLEVKAKGEVMEMRFPTLPEQLDYEKKLKKIDTSDVPALYKLNKDFVVSLGAKETVVDGLSTNNFFKLLDALASKKK